VKDLGQPSRAGEHSAEQPSRPLQKALAAAQRATVNDREVGFSNWASAELIGAATRSGMNEAAAGAYRQLAEITGAGGTDWALGVQARSHAPRSDGEEAEGLSQPDRQDSVRAIAPCQIRRSVCWNVNPP
jgi:hypothetical protein